MAPPALLVRPYVIDLESTNGTALNGERVAPARYVELRSGDNLRFGQSTREYVLVAEDEP
jgi:smad nuclear-interacting protein 1